jgi:hypothetical protein
MNVFLIILGMLGWIAAGVLFFLMSIVSQLYVGAKQQLQLITDAIKSEQPIDWNKWISPNE